MNKAHWLNLPLEGGQSAQSIQDLLDDSYLLTRQACSKIRPSEKRKKPFRRPHPKSNQPSKGNIMSIKVRGYAAQSDSSPLAPFEFERREVRSNDVEIDIEYCGVCHSDLHQAKNDWGWSHYPMVPGYEIVRACAPRGRGREQSLKQAIWWAWAAWSIPANIATRASRAWSNIAKTATCKPITTPTASAIICPLTAATATPSW